MHIEISWLWMGCFIIVLILMMGWMTIRRHSFSEQTKNHEMLGRIAAWLEQQQIQHQHLVEVLHQQEQSLNNGLMSHLATWSQQFQNSLEQNTHRTTTSLGELQTRLELIDKAQNKLQDISHQVVDLQSILSNKQARGVFGEMQLQHLIQTLMPNGCVEWQATLPDESGQQSHRRVDCLLKLPNPPGSIGIDAKFPLEGYRQLQSSQNEIERQQALRLFAQSIQKHLRDIAGRYIVPGVTADMAMMFIPSEAVFNEIHAQFPHLIEESYKLRVFMVSPSTLWATLHTIRALMKDVQIREQTQHIQTEIRKMMHDVARLSDRAVKLQNHFYQAQEDLRLIRISTDKIAQTTERIDQWDFENSTPLETPSSHLKVSGGAG